MNMVVMRKNAWKYLIEVVMVNGKYTTRKILNT